MLKTETRLSENARRREEKQNQRIGIIGIIQGGEAQAGGVSVLGESFAILKERRCAQLATRTLTPLRIINE